MQRVRSLLKDFPLGSLLFLLVILFFPIEHKYDRIIRPLFYRFTDIPRDTVKSLYFYITDLSILLFSVTFLYKKKDSIREFFLRGNAKLFLGVVFFAFLSLFLVKTPINILHWSKVFYFFITYLLYCLILSVFRSKRTRPFFILLFWGVVLLGVFECTVGIYQYFQQKPIGLQLLGEPKLKTIPDRVVIGTTKGNFWLFDALSPKSDEKVAIMRAYGTFPHPNVFGGFLTFSLFCTYALFLVSQFKGRSLLFGLLIFLQAFTLIITFSRSAFFAWAIGSILWFFLYLSNKERRKKSLPLALFFLTSLCMTILLFYPQIKARGGLISYTELARNSDQARLLAADLAWKVIQKNPLVGVGFSNYESAARPLATGPFHMIHNIYFLLAAEMGLIAFSLFALFLLFTLYQGWQKRENPFFASILAAFVAYLFIGLCDYYPLFFQQGRLLFFSLAAFLSLERGEE